MAISKDSILSSGLSEDLRQHLQVLYLNPAWQALYQAMVDLRDQVYQELLLEGSSSEQVLVCKGRLQAMERVIALPLSLHNKGIEREKQKSTQPQGGY